MSWERKERIISCMNAAVNLYGVVSFAELTGLYNRYAVSQSAPVSDLLMPEEIDEILAMPPPDDMDLESQEIFFSATEIDGERWLVSDFGLVIHPDEGPAQVDEEAVRDQLEDFLTRDLKILPEDDFFLYDEPMAFEETGVTKKVAKFLRQEYVYGKTEAELAVWDLQGEIRYSPTLKIALISAQNTLGLEVYDRDEFDDLVDVLTPLVRNTRAWDYRGHTETELVGAGVLDSFRENDGEEVFDLFLEDLEEGREDESEESEAGADDDWEPDAWDTGELSDKELKEILPPAEYPKGPVDFAFVKDPARRDRAVMDYENVRTVTSAFVREVLVKELSSKARKAAAKRLGLPSPAQGNYGPVEQNLDIVTGDFAIMLDDQFGETVLQRVLADEAKLSDYHRIGAAYFKNVRYAWLVVEAVKVGVGLKCHDLVSGKDLFLMEKSTSCSPGIKGMTICGSVAPMGDVYLLLGVQHTADFEPSAAIHRLVRQKLGLPLVGPLELSAADEARFAEDVIRRLRALGRFDNVVFGG